MKIWMTGIYVDDQDKALDFYKRVLGFKKKGCGTAWCLRRTTPPSSRPGDPGRRRHSVGVVCGFGHQR